MKENPLKNYPCVGKLGIHWTIMCVFVSFVGANIVMMETIKCLCSLSLFRKSANATTVVRELHLKVVVVLYSLFQSLDFTSYLKKVQKCVALQSHCGQRATPQSGRGLFQPLLPIWRKCKNVLRCKACFLIVLRALHYCLLQPGHPYEKTFWEKSYLLLVIIPPLYARCHCNLDTFMLREFRVLLLSKTYCFPLFMCC